MQNRVVQVWLLFLVVMSSVFMFSCTKEPDIQETYEVLRTDTTVVISVNGSTFTMILVEGGTFEMGATAEQGVEDPDENEYPVHVVNLSTFYICQTEVTQELWKAVMGVNPSMIHGYVPLPVDCVKWDMCQEFITALNEILDYQFEIRMPTEAEWEYAARGGNCNNGYKYAGSNYLDTVAWFEETTEEEGTKPVKLKTPNELGLYDMSGNVWEWCHDWYDSSYYSNSPSNNPQGPSKGSYRVMRGGCWGSYEKYCRVSSRSYFDMESSYDRNGFRLCLSQ